MTSYDLCKQECKRQRDQQSSKDVCWGGQLYMAVVIMTAGFQYVVQLREELRMAEEQERLMEQQSQQEVTLNPDTL